MSCDYVFGGFDQSQLYRLSEKSTKLLEKYSYAKEQLWWYFENWGLWIEWAVFEKQCIWKKWKRKYWWAFKFFECGSDFLKFTWCIVLREKNSKSWESFESFEFFTFNKYKNCNGEPISDNKLSQVGSDMFEGEWGTRMEIFQSIDNLI